MADDAGYALPEGRLESRFVDKAPPYVPGAAAAEATRCLYCHDAPCIAACPTAIDIPTFIRKIATGNLRGSARTILEANLLGASCSRVCPVEVLCVGACVYNHGDQPPIAIGRLQRFAMEAGRSADLLPRRPPTGRTVGLVGGGPASLACAGTLALAGHQAVIYERRDYAGGLNTDGVAPYKMSAAAALDEVRFVRDLGVEVRTGVDVGTDVSFDELLERHDALFLGVGLGEDSRLPVPGAAGPGVMGAVAWIRSMKLDPAASLDGVRSVAVVGGGNTALDVARETAQLGVPLVRLVYRRGEADMKGYRHEWMQAKQEGVVLIPGAVVTEVVRGDDGAPAHLRLARADDGRPTDEELDPLPVDLVVVAIGQARLVAALSAVPGLELDGRGRIVVDAATGVTGHPRVFAGGDAVNGGKEVVNAVDEGQRAARGLDALLRADSVGGDDA